MDYLVKDLSQRFKNFYYNRALLCERLINTPVGDKDNPIANYYIDAYVICFAALDGLSSVWSSLNSCSKSNRFSEFLIYVDKISINNINANDDIYESERMQRVCIPFLYSELKRQGYEDVFASEIMNKWMKPHLVLFDPTTKQTNEVYEECNNLSPNPNFCQLKDPQQVFKQFRYANLIYKFYRCSFVHEFRASKYTTLFNKNQEISIRMINGYPQLDVGIDVLINFIRIGADYLSNLIVEHGLTDTPIQG